MCVFHVKLFAIYLELVLYIGWAIAMKQANSRLSATDG